MIIEVLAKHQMKFFAPFYLRDTHQLYKPFSHRNTDPVITGERGRVARGQVEVDKILVLI